MKSISAKITNGLQIGSYVPVCDNSGAKLLKITAVIGGKTRKGRIAGCGVGSLVMASVKRGKQDVRKQVVYAVIVRQAKEYRRPDGMRVKFEENGAAVLKDKKGNPKGTRIKGPVAKEVAERWPSVAKLSSIIV